MARLLSGFLGPIIGKIGGAIGSNWKGINTLREYKIPANPNSVGQQAQRTKFKAVIALAQSLLPTLITTFWNPFAVKMSGMNYFVMNIFSSVTSVGLIQQTSPVTKGTLESSSFDSIAQYTTGTGAFSSTLSTDISGNGLSTDEINLLIVDSSDNTVCFYELANSTRDDGSVAGTASTGKTATDLILFAWYSRGTGSEFVVSDSVGIIMEAP